MSFFQTRLSVPVIVVGNISLGGTGKTPLLIALVEYFQSQQKKVGVVSRGYGAKAPFYPYLVDKNSIAAEVGDEPLMIYQRTSALVCVGPDRIAAAKKLIETGCDLILSDDGLQHYALGRDIEILVVDAARQFGNGCLLPVGPLRETLDRVDKVSFVLINETNTSAEPLKQTLKIKNKALNLFAFKLQPKNFLNIKSSERTNLQSFVSKLTLSSAPVYALAAIGNPQGFFLSLKQIGLNPQTLSFPDHYKFTETDFQSFEQYPVIMTEKDAVKVQSFAKDNWYSLETGLELDLNFLGELTKKISELNRWIK